jgi:serine/threonine protein kinase
MATKISFKITRTNVKQEIIPKKIEIKENPIQNPITKEKKFEEIKKEQINNNTNSVMSTTPKSLNEIYNDIDELNKYLIEKAPEFYEKFELLEFKKCGSAGSVLKAQTKIKAQNSKAKPKIVALKFLFNGKEGKAKKEINHQEIIAHGSLKHKNIPQIYGYYKIGDNSCIAMEYSHYGDLENFKKKVIKRAPLSESLICYILGGLAEAVYYIHTHNKIIHMDIKQQNIVIDDYLNVKLTDYSISINYRNLKNISLPMIGTCYYMSPEVLKKETIPANYASKIDVYSIGVLLYLLAFCDYPFKLKEVDNKNYAQILKNIQQYDLEFPTDMENSKPFLNLLRNCLNKDIKKRYDIYQLMNDPFVKGYQIILNEKEKLYNAGKFVIDLMVDNILNFNQYLKTIENNNTNFFP